MDQLVLGLVALVNFVLIGIFIFVNQRLKKSDLQHFLESEKTERELKRRVLELQVLRSLGERVGYSLDLVKILEVIIDSLTGLVDFAAVSYMLRAAEGRIILKTRVAAPVSRQFSDQVKDQMLKSFSAIIGQDLQPSLVNETTSGSALDDRSTDPVQSFFNLPITIGNQVVALVNVSSPNKGLYGDEETAILYTIFNQVSSQASKLSQVIENEKRRLAAMVSSLTDGILMVDLGFNLIVSNPAIVDLLSLKEGFSLYDIFSVLSSKVDLRTVMYQSTREQKVVKIPEFELNNKAFEIDVEPVKDKYGYILGAAVLVRNITAQKQLERLREDFTAMMVHELRTPLTTISFSTDMMLSDPANFPPDQVNKNLAIIKGSAAHMLSLVNDLLSVAKIEAGRFAIVKKPELIGSLIQERVEAFKPLAEQKNLAITQEVAPDIIPIMFDRVRLGQTLDNLISNAIKYTESGGIAVKAGIIKTHGQTRYLEVSVADSGAGIKSEDMPKLFSKFDQLGKGKTGETSGTGLGLVIAKGIVEAHGGKITVVSKGAGQGSTFTFTIPA